MRGGCGVFDVDPVPFGGQMPVAVPPDRYLLTGAFASFLTTSTLACE